MAGLFTLANEVGYISQLSKIFKGFAMLKLVLSVALIVKRFASPTFKSFSRNRKEGQEIEVWN